MNSTITLPELVKLLSAITNSSEATAQQFLSEFFNAIGDALAEGKNVKIKNIGTFAPDSLRPGEIKFLPDSDLAEAVNHPFAFFEPVELDDDLTDEELATADTPSEPSQEPEIETVEEPKIEDAASTDATLIETSSEVQLSPDIEERLLPESKDDSATVQAQTEATDVEKAEPSNTVEEPSCDSDSSCQSSAQRGGVNPWLMFAIGLLTGVVVGYLLPAIKEGVTSLWMATPQEFAEPNQPLLPTHDESGQTDIDNSWESRDAFDHSSATDTSKQSATVSAKPIETQQSSITDTIGRNRFLTTMSRKYYGRYEFWVYIYEENASHLGNPDRIAPGTVVSIPAADKYDINPDDPQSLKKAAIKAEEIYAPYQK